MPTKKISLPSMKQLKRVLSLAAFNPRLPGPMSAMVKIADRNYLEKRAIEFISEAEACRIFGIGKKDFDLAMADEEYFKHLKRAIQCLALAIIKEE